MTKKNGEFVVYVFHCGQKTMLKKMKATNCSFISFGVRIFFLLLCEEI